MGRAVSAALGLTPQPMSTPTVIKPPVAGEWGIFNPPGHPPLAFDFLAVQGRRNPYRNASLLRHLLGRITVEDTHAWGKPVFAVLPGTVVAASDGVADRHHLSMLVDLVRLLAFGPKPQPPFSNLGGNYVILDCGGVFPLYAHLRCGSVKVKIGQQVTVGQPIGEVGNSGASLQPHLHFQLMSNADPFPLFQNLLPMKLSLVRRRRDDSWLLERECSPRSGEHYEFSESAA